MISHKKFIAVISILVLFILPGMSIFGDDDGYLDSDFVQEIVQIASEFAHDDFELILMDVTKPDTDRKFFDSRALFKLQTDIQINNFEFLESGKYFTALFIDSDGIFDLGNVFFSEEKEGYNPKITSVKDSKYKTFYGTESGRHYLVGILSDTIPYFGNMYNNNGGKNPIAKKRYVENFKKQLEEKKASTYIVEFSINSDELID